MLSGTFEGMSNLEPLLERLKIMAFRESIDGE